MANVSIYLPDQVATLARKAAKREKLSVSKWISREITKSLGSRWPEEFLAAAGAEPGFPSLEEIRRGYGADRPREKI